MGWMLDRIYVAVALGAGGFGQSLGAALPVRPFLGLFTALVASNLKRSPTSTTAPR